MKKTGDIAKLHAADKLAAKSKLTEQDVKELATKMDNGIADMLRRAKDRTQKSKHEKPEKIDHDKIAYGVSNKRN